MAVDTIVNSLSPIKMQKTTPPRVVGKTTNSVSFKQQQPTNSSSHFNSSKHSDDERPIIDDLLTEDETDVEEEKLMARIKDNDISSPLDYDDYDSTHPANKSYHPTSSIFENTGNKKEDNQPGSFLNPQFSSTTHEDSFRQDIYERSSFYRRPSQLQHEATAMSLNALGPPSHVLKARRLSKTVIKSSTSTPITPVKSLSTSSQKDKRKPSLVNNYSKEFSDSNNSAVSPRFMALRKLSEVTALPTHSLSHSAVPPSPPPPVPQIPSHLTTNDRTETMTTNNKDHENRVLARIDDIIETQLQFHLGQVIWRASESQLEARKFWEDQKKEMFGFAATLVERMETQEDMLRRTNLGSLSSAREDSSLKQELLDCKKQVEVLTAKHAELEQKHTETLKQVECSQKLQQEQLQSIQDLDDNNAQLLKENTMLKFELQNRDPLFKRKASLASSTGTLRLGRKNSNVKNSETWADIMESEDEAKKSAEEWATKYRELQSSYFEACLQVEKLKVSGASVEDEKKIFDLSQSILAKDEEIRQQKQAESVNQIQIDYLQQELEECRKSVSPVSAVDASVKANLKCKCRTEELSSKNEVPVDTKLATVPQKSPSVTDQQEVKAPSPDTFSSNPQYVTENGFLTFTTEINGMPSTYSIKLPGEYQKKPTKKQIKSQEPKKAKKNQLNPNAPIYVLNHSI